MTVAPTIGGLLGQRIRELRKKRGLTQVEFAALCGVPQSRISTIENGSRIPNLETVLRLASALDCKVTALMSIFDNRDLLSLVLKRPASPRSAET